MPNIGTNILVLRFSSIGDIIQTTSVLNTIKKYFPRTSITYLTLSKYKPLLKNHPSIDNLLSINPKKDQTGLKKIKKIYEKNSFDLIVDLHNSLRSKLIRRKFSNIDSVYVRKPRMKRLALFLNHINRFENGFNQRSWLHDPLKNFLPTDTVYSSISLNLSKKEVQDAKNFLNKSKKNSKNYFSIIPGAAWFNKEWGIEKYISVIKLCAKKYDLIPVLVGSLEDTICFEIEKKTSLPIINLAGKTNLRESMAIIQKSLFCIGSDTGFTYAAEAFGVPTIVILGPTSKETGAGLISKNSINLHAGNLWCRPCSQNGSFPCYRDKKYCMENISTEKVIAHISNFLN